MPSFLPNYPFYDPGKYTLLPTPERIGALSEYTGQGVVIAFIDAGFYPHPDLGDRILVHVDATTHRIVESPAITSIDNRVSWHGQMTTVIAAGDGMASGGKYRGVASSARLVLIKVANRRGKVKEPDIQRGLDWLVKHHHRFSIRIVNISVGGDFESHDPLHPHYQAIRSLAKAGIVVVTAAGNKGTRVLVPPASAPEAITVGGVDDQNSPQPARWHPYHNSYGLTYEGKPKPEVTAPAAWIASPIMPGTTIAREARWLASLLHAPTPAAIRRVLSAGYADLGFSRRHVQNPHAEVYQVLQSR
jgi:serine protease AprX